MEGARVMFPWLTSASGAVFGDDCNYRYLLWRTWSIEKGVLNFLMLNPSTAGSFRDDPTVHRCRRWAYHWGYGGLVVTNIHAFRATDPRKLWKREDPTGPENDRYIVMAAKAAGCVVCAWGVHGAKLERSKAVKLLLRDTPLYAMKITGSRQLQPRAGFDSTSREYHGATGHCNPKVERLTSGLPQRLKITGSGEPCHPLYLPGKLTPIPFSEGAPEWVRPGPDPNPTEQLSLEL